MRVELLYDPDCPHTNEARLHLQRACEKTAAPVQWTEWDRSSRGNPAYVRRFGSPTILVDGHDVAGAAPTEEAAHCRLYGAPGAYRGAPSVELITQALLRARPPMTPSPAWRQSLLALPGTLVSVLPFGGCPACWPVYAGVLSALGLSFLLSSRYLLPLTAACLLIAVVTLGRGARTRRGYGPFVLGLVAAALVFSGKFALGSDPVSYAGVALLVLSSVWNVWPRRVAAPCPKCAPLPSGLVQLSAEEKSS